MIVICTSVIFYSFSLRHILSSFPTCIIAFNQCYTVCEFEVQFILPTCLLPWLPQTWSTQKNLLPQVLPAIIYTGQIQVLLTSSGLDNCNPQHAQCLLPSSWLDDRNVKWFIQLSSFYDLLQGLPLFTLYDYNIHWLRPLSWQVNQLSSRL